jgi:hypothetical protein
MAVRAGRVTLLAIVWLLAGPWPATAAPDAAASRALYERHCAGCHAGGATPGDLRHPRGPGCAPPDLTRLRDAYGSPLPRAHLLHHVLDARRRGGARICGDHDLWWGDRGHDAALLRRGTVLVVLDYLESLQHERPDLLPRDPPSDPLLCGR